MVEGLAKGDAIELRDTTPKGFDVVSRFGNLCVWFYFPEVGVEGGGGGGEPVVAVKQSGGVCDGGGNTNLISSVPVSFGFSAAEALFDDVVGRYPGSSWLSGNVYDSWNDFEPLGWWE